MNASKLICLMSIVFTIVGCSSKRNLEGEIFLEVDGAVQKIAMADVQIIPEDQFRNHIKQKLSSLDQEVKRLGEQIALKEVAARKLDEGNNTIMKLNKDFVAGLNQKQIQNGKIQRDFSDLDSARRAGLNITGEELKLKLAAIGIKEKIINEKYAASVAIQKIMENTPVPIPNNPGEIHDMNNVFEEAAKYYQESVNVILALEKEVAGLKGQQAGLTSGLNGSYYYDKPIADVPNTVTSSSDGKFQATIEGRGRYVIAASKKDKKWIIWLPEDKSINTISLSNKNLIETSCANCVFNEKVTPKTF